MNVKELQSKAGAAEAMLKAVANRNRLVILCELLKGERSVGALQAAIGNQVQTPRVKGRQKQES